MQAHNLVQIAPPPPVCTYPNGEIQPWGDHLGEGDRLVFALALAPKLKRIDQAVLAKLFCAHGFDSFTLDLQRVDEVCAELSHWGDKASRNEVANSLKRCARLGYLSDCPKEVFQAGRHGTTRQALRAAVLERDGHKCLHCGRAEFLEADHIIPRSKGGETILENLQTLCAGCNRLKGTSQ